MNNYIILLDLGDVSGDGHEKYSTITYISNYPANVVSDAYIKSCNKTHIRFNSNLISLGITEPNTDNWEVVLSDYMDNTISQKAAKKISEYGINMSQYIDESNKYTFNIAKAANLIMEFISLSMPNDWEYSEVSKDAQTIFNFNVGYGLYT